MGHILYSKTNPHAWAKPRFQAQEVRCLGQRRVVVPSSQAKSKRQHWAGTSPAFWKPKASPGNPNTGIFNPSSPGMSNLVPRKQPQYFFISQDYASHNFSVYIIYIMQSMFANCNTTWCVQIFSTPTLCIYMQAWHIPVSSKI
jgi:hypothetical protein